MKGRQYFLVFFLAIAGSALITIFLDSGTRDWEAYDAESLAAHFAAPVGEGDWVIQWIVRSELPIPYTRVLLYSTSTSDGTFVDNFEDQLYPMGFTENGLAFFRDPSLIEALRESQLSSRLFAPERIQGDIVYMAANGTTTSVAYDVEQGGIPFLCGDAVITTSYGNSDTSFYRIKGGKAKPWIVIRDEISDVPYCAADQTIYLRSDTQSYRVSGDSVQSLDKAKLYGGMTLDGSWLGIPQPNGCKYIADEYGKATSMVEVKTASNCSDNFYATDQWQLSGDEQNLELTYRGETKKIAGRLIGVHGDSFAVADSESVTMFWLAQQKWLQHRLLNSDWIKRLPKKDLKTKKISTNMDDR
jgi:hypothetical protein